MESREAELRSLEELMCFLVSSREKSFSSDVKTSDYVHRNLKDAQNRYKTLTGRYFSAGIDDSWRFERD